MRRRVLASGDSPAKRLKRCGGEVGDNVFKQECLLEQAKGSSGRV